MTVYSYRHVDSFDSEVEQASIADYAQTLELTVDEHLVDETNVKDHWTERKIGELLLKVAQPGDTLLCFDASQLACSTSQILELLSKAADYQVAIHFVKYDMSLKNDTSVVDTKHLLDVIGRIESDFISKRTTQALARRKAAGLPLGRPKGRGNKSLKLDKHKDDIKKYLSLGISKASIAKLVDCHPQTLYDWLDRNEINVEEFASKGNKQSA